LDSRITPQNGLDWQFMDVSQIGGRDGRRVRDR
jgi:hypothetical protein